MQQVAQFMNRRPILEEFLFWLLRIDDQLQRVALAARRLASEHSAWLQERGKASGNAQVVGRHKPDLRVGDWQAAISSQ